MPRKTSTNCKICGHRSQSLFRAKLIKKYNVTYFQCPRCSFVQTEKPYWLKEAYVTPINISDTGIVSRNLSLCKATASILYLFFDQHKSFLDYAGGYGLMTRLMRDLGFDFYHMDPHCENLFAKGFEYHPDIKIETITAFEVFEHFVNPLDEIQKMINISPNIVFSTWLLPQPVPQPNEWWYYGFEHGQHIAFYGLETLHEIARKLGLNFYTNQKNIHLLTKKNIKQPVFKSVLRLKEILYHYVKKRSQSLTLSDHKNLKHNHKCYHEQTK
jgi:hypothetical protein